MNNDVKEVQQLIIKFVSEINDSKFLNFIYRFAKSVYTISAEDVKKC